VSALEKPGYVFRPLRRAEYEALVAAGAFADERVELLEGFLVEMSPQRAPHASAIEVLTRLLCAACGSENKVRVQLPLALSDESEPEPDLCVVPAGDYRTQHPTAALLVIEVSHSSLERDRRKAALYARARVPTYWLVDVDQQRVEVRTEPDATGYAQLATIPLSGFLECAALPALKVPVALVFGG
jgi:Uma2 family endonuclease